MNDGSDMRWRILNALLILLLITAQTSAFAHSYEHDWGSVRDTACASCATASQFAAACVDTGISVEVQTYGSSVIAGQDYFFTSVHVLSSRQRGPPIPR